MIHDFRRSLSSVILADLLFPFFLGLHISFFFNCFRFDFSFLFLLLYFFIHFLRFFQIYDIYFIFIYLAQQVIVDLRILKFWAYLQLSLSFNFSSSLMAYFFVIFTCQFGDFFANKQKKFMEFHQFFKNFELCSGFFRLDTTEFRLATTNLLLLNNADHHFSTTYFSLIFASYGFIY